MRVRRPWSRWDSTSPLSKGPGERQKSKGREFPWTEKPEGTFRRGKCYDVNVEVGNVKILIIN